MSYSYDNLSLTDDEREAGIYYLLHGDCYYPIADDEQEEYIDYLLSTDDAGIADQSTTNNITNYNKEKDKIIYTDVIKLIAGLNTNIQIQNKVIKKLFLYNLDCMIDRYSKQQKLPYEYVKVAKQKNCLEILIKGFLKKNGNYILTSDIIHEIDLFVEEIYLNIDTDIVYDRVQKIQKFIHNKIDEKNGENSHLNLHSKTIKNLLSSARLHLNLQDIKYKDTESLCYLIKQSEYVSKLERNSPTKMLSSSGEIYTTKKKIRDIKSLIDFGYSMIASKIYDISNLNINIPLNEFRNRVIEIYNEQKNHNPKDKPKWI